jgi:hypothetical protein
MVMRSLEGAAEDGGAEVGLVMEILSAGWVDGSAIQDTGQVEIARAQGLERQ